MTTDQGWTTAQDVEAAILRLWLKGRLLSAKVTGETIFPVRLGVRAPDSRSLTSRFGEAQAWIGSLEAASRVGRGFGFDLVWREIRHPQLGRNRLPVALVVPDEADALQLIGKRAEARRFDALAGVTAEAFPELMPWLARKPLLALEHAADWASLLGVLAWFRDNPRSGLYLRQVDIPQVDTKFIEGRRGLLAELLNVVLAPASLEATAGEPATFESRFGLRNKPATVRFRLLDGQSSLAGLSDISTPADEFARLALDPKVVFITENEVNGLTFPSVPGAMVLFGLGYSLDILARSEWLGRSRLVYWGDIDTHGFAMLARLRSYFPKAQSLLMDEATLFAHRPFWVREERPFAGELPLLHADEHRLFEDLRLNRHGDQVRLEQERIGYGRLMTALRGLAL